jgi:ABC-type glycerol-3-phosphate transport system substrate-binding protein
MNNSKGPSVFQIGVIIACVAGVVFSLLIFSGKIPVGDSSAATTLKGSVAIWGTLSGDAVRAMTDQLHQTYKDVNFSYVEKTPASFQPDLVNALASGSGPDLIFVSPSDIIQNKDRLLEIPYASLPQASFQGAFIDQGNLFLTSTGVLALPFVVDPLVMYYNRDLLSGSFTVNPPQTWDDVVALNKKITAKDDAGKLTTETVALGTFDNITNAKDIISAMIFQTGNKIVAWDPLNKKYASQFSQPDASGNSGVAKALTFYTAFSNVNDADHYSWNGSLPKDKSQFIAGKLAIYFGYASELGGIRQLNPNLNFDVSIFPQRSTGNLKATYGKMVGLAVVKVSKNSTLALAMAQQLVAKDNVATYRTLESTSTPARRDMLAQATDDAHQTLFYKSAIISQGLLDPDPNQTTPLFKKFIDQINAGIAQPNAILSPGDSLMSSILGKIQRDTSSSQ